MKRKISGILVALGAIFVFSKLAEDFAGKSRAAPLPLQPTLQDEAVRAFLGIRSSRVDLKIPASPVLYATTFAKFQKGHFVGFGPLATGMNQPQSSHRYVEVAWGANSGKMGYVFVHPFGSYPFTPDPFFEHLTETMTGIAPLPKRPQFRGFEVIGYAESDNARGSASKLFLASDIEHEFQVYDYGIAILYREFENQADYAPFVSAFQKSNQP